MTTSFFLLIVTRSGPQARFGWSVCIAKSLKTLCISFYGTYSGLSKYRWLLWRYFNLEHNSRLSSIFFLWWAQMSVDSYVASLKMIHVKFHLMVTHVNFKYQSLSQFPEKHLSHSIVLNFVFFWVGLLYSLVIRITVLLCLLITYICYSVAYYQWGFHIIGLYGVILCFLLWYN